MLTQTIIYHRKEIEIKVPMIRVRILYPKMIVHLCQEIYHSYFNDILYIYIKFFFVIN